MRACHGALVQPSLKWRDVANYPFATLSVDGTYRFYAVSLTTGQAFSLGGFDEPVVDVAIPLNQ